MPQGGGGVGRLLEIEVVGEFVGELIEIMGGWFGVRQFARVYFILFVLLGFSITAFTQSVTLSVGSNTGKPGGTVSVPIVLTSTGGAQTAGIQWNFGFTSDIAGVNVTAGPSATNAGKSVSCAGNICIIFGVNGNVLADGIVATATFQIASKPSTTAIPVQLASVAASTALGAAIPTTGGSGIISPSVPAASLSGLSCATTTLTTPGSTSCVVSITPAAPDGGFVVSLASGNANVTVPAAVTVAAGQTSASFTAIGALVSTNQTAVLAASGGSVSLTSTLNLVAQGQIASLSCAPSALAGNSSGTCTVSLNQAATSATVITLVSNNATVSVPGSVTIPANQASAVFSAVAGAVTARQSVTLMAILGSSAVQTSVSVIAGLKVVGTMPHLAAEGGWNTTFTLANKSSSPAETVVSLFADDGTALALPLTFPQQASSGPSTEASVDQSLAGNALLIVDASGPANVPYSEGAAQLEATDAVDGFAIFHFDPSQQEAVVPMETRNAPSYLLAFDNTNTVLTGVAMENVSASAASIPVIIRDDTGTLVATGSIPLPGNSHTSFVLSTELSATANIRGTIEFDTPGFGSATPGRISVLGIRYTPPGTLTTIPALAGVGTTGGFMAHLASGGGWETTFVLVNTGTSAAQAQLNFFDDNGNPLPLPLTSPQSGGPASTTASSVLQSLGPNASLWIQSTGALTDPLLTGSAQLTTTGNISGFVIFRYNPNGQEAVVPLESRNAGAYLLAFDNTNGIATGVAINAVSSQAMNVPVILRDDTGTQIGAGSIALAANGHSSQMLTTLFPAAAGIRGTVEFDAPSGTQISVLGIRSPPALTFTTLPPLAR